VTANLPRVQRVQILVEGKEVDTIAGHVDVRRPLQGDMSLVARRSPIQNSKCKNAQCLHLNFEFCITVKPPYAR
jgi:hypothetical protein